MSKDFGSMYGDDAAAAPESETLPPDRNMRDGEQDGDGEQQPQLINSEISPGMKPGDMITLRVLKVHPDEYEVALEQKEGDDNPPDEGMEAPPEEMDAGEGNRYAAMMG